MDTLEADWHLVQGEQVGCGGEESELSQSWKEMWGLQDVSEELAFLKVKTFTDSARDTDAKWQHRVQLCMCVYIWSYPQRKMRISLILFGQFHVYALKSLINTVDYFPLRNNYFKNTVSVWMIAWSRDSLIFLGPLPTSL